MAITAHYINQSGDRWILEARLIAFQYMPGSHDGMTLGSTFVDILKRHKIAHKVGQVTADNASNNGTMTDAIESGLHANRIPFSSLENRIRYVAPLSMTITKLSYYNSCFPHVINLAVQDFLDTIGKIDARHCPGVAKDLFDAVKRDPVQRCRDLVTAIRSSSQRRDEFRKAVADAATNQGVAGNQLELLRDMPVRWSSTFNMITRFLTLSPVSIPYLDSNVAH
jgi:hypothetical protein